MKQLPKLDSSLYGATLEDGLKKTVRDFNYCRGRSFWTTIKKTEGSKKEGFGNGLILSFKSDGPELTDIYGTLRHLIALTVLGPNHYYEYVKYFMKSFFQANTYYANKAAKTATEKLAVIRSDFLCAIKVLDYEKESNSLVFKVGTPSIYEIKVAPPT